MNHQEITLMIRTHATAPPVPAPTSITAPTPRLIDTLVTDADHLAHMARENARGFDVVAFARGLVAVQTGGRS